MAITPLSKRKPLVTLDDFIGTYSSGSDTWQSRKAVESLASKGDLPFTFTNPHFFDINILAAWLFWSGSIHNYDGNINAGEEHHEGIVSSANNVGIEIKIYGENDLSFSKNGAAYSRLMVALGVPNSEGSMDEKDSKVEKDIELPYYVRFLAKNYRNFGRADKRIATKVLADQCRILMWARGVLVHGGYRIQLTKNRNQTVSERLGMQVMKVFNAIYLKIGLDDGCLRTAEYNANHETHITLKQGNVFNAIEYYGLFSICSNHNYHTPGKKTIHKGR